MPETVSTQAHGDIEIVPRASSIDLLLDAERGHVAPDLQLSPDEAERFAEALHRGAAEARHRKDTP